VDTLPIGNGVVYFRRLASQSALHIGTLPICGLLGHLPTEVNMATSTDASAKRQEEFFGIAPKCLVDDIYNAVDDFISDAVDSLECHIAREMRIGEEGPRRRVSYASFRMQAMNDAVLPHTCCSERT
jgi:hypothetical protein